jgi:hypothetical protein
MGEKMSAFDVLLDELNDEDAQRVARDNLLDVLAGPDLAAKKPAD